MEPFALASSPRIPWNKGKLVGQKAPLRISEIWAIRVRLRVLNVCHGSHVAHGASVIQQKTKQPVQFELTKGTRQSISTWMASADLRSTDFLFPSRIAGSPHISTRQYARIVHQWFDEIGLDPTAYGTHTMRRTKPTLTYRRTKNLRAVQLLLGHTDSGQRCMCPNRI